MRAWNKNIFVNRYVGILNSPNQPIVTFKGTVTPSEWCDLVIVIPDETWKISRIFFKFVPNEEQQFKPDNDAYK